MLSTSNQSASVKRQLNVVLPFIVLLFALSTLANAATLPLAPQTFDTSYLPPAGATITVAAGGDLQAAINAAKPGDTIVVEAGASFTGPFVLPNKTGGNSWIYIRSSAYSNLPAPGTRVSPANAASMPKLRVGAGGNSAIETANGAHNFRFVGIEVLPVSGSWVTTLIMAGLGDTSVATLPRDIVFDRCYIHADATVGGRRGIAMNGIAIAVVDSYLSGFREVGADTQAVWSYNGPGPLKVVNNYLEAAGENLMIGGKAAGIVDVVPSDIEIRDNHFFKPLSWQNQNYTVKNLIEFKMGVRVLVANNKFENNWPGAQVGFAVQITPRNEDSSAPWSAVTDLTFANNVIINSPQGINIAGEDSNRYVIGTQYSSKRAERILIQNNLIVSSTAGITDGRLFQVLYGPKDLTIDHNTAFADKALIMAENIQQFKADNFVFTNNIVSFGTGIAGTGSGGGTNTLTDQFTNWSLSKNAIVGIQEPPYSRSSYPTGNYWPADIAAVKFVGMGTGDYRLAADSPYKGMATDGSDLGANLQAGITFAPPQSGAAPGSPTNIQVN